MKIMIVSFLIIFTSPLLSKTLYFNKLMGHIHKTPLTSGESVTAIQCGMRLRVLKKSKKIPKSWSYVKYADIRGFVKKELLSKKKPLCFQEKYNRYYNLFEFDLSELYYFGKLGEQFISGESQGK